VANTLKNVELQCLTSVTELRLVKAINTLAAWKYPLSSTDIRLLVKDYLDHCSVNDTRFENNTPGPDRMSNFIRRHKFTTRLDDKYETLTSRSYCWNSFNQYFDEQEPCQKQYNYHETCTTDEP